MTLPSMPASTLVIQQQYAWLYGRICDALGTFSERVTITPEAAMIVAFLGDREMTAIEIKRSGYYIGTNPSHNLRKLEVEGLIYRLTDKKDRRLVRVALTQSGLKLCVYLRKHLQCSEGVKVA